MNSQIRKVFVLLFFITATTGTIAQSANEVYLFSYFKDNGQDGLHLAYSLDGYTWKSLKRDSSFLVPIAGKDKLMRDPCIIRGGDNKFHMVWTVSWNEKGIGYASSDDLVNWSEQQYIPVMEHEDSARNCWAPEIFYEDETKEYMIYWATTIPGRFPVSEKSGDDKYNHRIYYTTTKDFKTFSKTQLLYDQGFNVIDATIIKTKKQYVMILKDETRNPPQKNLRVVTSRNLTHGYGKPSPPITGNYWAEGPTVLKVRGQWIVYFDKYTQHLYGAVISKDLGDWIDISGKISFPKGARHGTAFIVSRKEFERLSGKK